MDDKQCCGNCGWWNKQSLLSSGGWCKWSSGDPVPEWISAISCNYRYYHDGADCPCHKYRETPNDNTG